MPKFIQFQVVYKQLNYKDREGDERTSETDSIYAMDDNGNIYRTDVEDFNWDTNTWNTNGWRKIDGP